MQTADVRFREILSLKTRTVTTIVENFSSLFVNRAELLDLIPKTLRQEIFNRLINRGILSNELFGKVIDKSTDLLDLKSARTQFDNDSCLIVKSFENLRALFLTQVLASSESLSTLFSKLYRLRTLEITNSSTFNDTVLKSVAENCACLKVLNVSRTSIGDDGLCSLALFSISLMALDISYTTVSFTGIEKLIASPSGQTLKELKCTKTKIAGRQEILSSILGFKKLEDYSFTFNSNEEADWVLGRVTARLKNFAFNIPF